MTSTTIVRNKRGTCKGFITQASKQKFVAARYVGRTTVFVSKSFRTEAKARAWVLS